MTSYQPPLSVEQVSPKTVLYIFDDVGPGTYLSQKYLREQLFGKKEKYSQPEVSIVNSSLHSLRKVGKIKKDGFDKHRLREPHEDKDDLSNKSRSGLPQSKTEKPESVRNIYLELRLTKQPIKKFLTMEEAAQVIALLLTIQDKDD
jgi:hypothetical protein